MSMSRIGKCVLNSRSVCSQFLNLDLGILHKLFFLEKKRILQKHAFDPENLDEVLASFFFSHGTTSKANKTWSSKWIASFIIAFLYHWIKISSFTYTSEKFSPNSLQSHQLSGTKFSSKCLHWWPYRSKCRYMKTSENTHKRCLYYGERHCKAKNKRYGMIV